MTVIDVNSSKERSTCKRKSDENYLPYYLRHYEAEFISRNLVLNLM